MRALTIIAASVLIQSCAVIDLVESCHNEPERCSRINTGPKVVTDINVMVGDTVVKGTVTSKVK